MEVLQRTANRGSIATGGYEIANSLKFEPDNTEYMRRSNGTNGNQRVFTQSMWIKRTEISDSYATPWSVGSLGFRFGSDDSLRVWCYTYDGIGAGTSNVDSYRIITPNKFRDTSAWYHLVFALDTTQSTESDRLKVYVNNERVYHNGSSDVYDQTITQNSYTRCNGTGNSSQNWNQIGWWWSGSYVFAGYIAEVNFVDGLQLSPTDVGEYDEDSGIWKPKKYDGAYGTNGYYLKFDDASDLGKDSSGNNNDMNSIGNITAADQATDTPTNNFCTFNPLMTQNNPPTISEGAMKSTGGGGTWNNTWGNMGVKNGKWYYEMKATNTSYTGYFGASTAPAEGSNTTGASVAYNTSFWVGEANSIDYYYWQNGSLTANESTGWGGFSNNDVLGLALDLDSSTKKFYLYKNGSLLNSGGTNLPTNMQDEFVFPLYVQYENRQDELNFGGYTISTISSAASDANGYGTFEYAPPSGYYALCTKNLAEYG